MAEFKFIAWRGGAESIRQNGLFIDIFRLALTETDRRKVVYLTGLEHPLRFLRGRRALTSVLSKSASAAARFGNAYGDRYVVVSDYWRDVSGTVELVDLLPLVPALAALPEEPACARRRSRLLRSYCPLFARLQCRLPPVRCLTWSPPTLRSVQHRGWLLSDQWSESSLNELRHLSCSG